MKKALIVIILFVLTITIINFENLKCLAQENLEKENQLQFEQSKKNAAFDILWNENHTDSFFNEAFAGAFFDGDKLVVNVVEDSLSDFVENYNVSSEITVAAVKYSLNDLKNARNEVMKLERELSLSAIAIDDSTNSLVVYTNNLADYVEKSLKDEIEFENITVIGISSENETYARYTSNGEFIRIDSAMLCTVGFAAYDSLGNPGIVTAGHCIHNDGNIYNPGTNMYYLGLLAGNTTSIWSFSDDTNTDAAFIKLRDPFIGTTWLPSHDLVFGGSYYAAAIVPGYLVQGTSVKFHGRFDDNLVRSNDLPEPGNVIYTSFNYKVDVMNGTQYYWINDQIKTDITGHPGDSGGPLTYQVWTGGLTTVTNVMGILSGGNSYYGVTYFTKVSNIFNDLNLGHY